MPEAISTAIMGHTYGSPVSHGYGQGPGLAKMAAWIEKVDPFRY
jgi:hypothetical protein